MASGTGKRSFPELDPVTVYASRRIIEWLELPDDDEGAHTQERLARAAGLAGATIFAIKMKEKPAGTRSAPGLARAFGMTYAAFIEAAERECGDVRSLAEPTSPTRYGEKGGEDRYAVAPLVRDAARSDGIPEDFVESFVAQFDYDGQPPFSMIYDLLKAEWARERGKGHGNAARPEDF